MIICAIKQRTKTHNEDANKTAFIIVFTSFAFYNDVYMKDGRADVRINI